MDKLLNIHTEEVQLDRKDTFDNHRYEPTSYDVIKTLCENYNFNKDDIVIDYGSGLGRLNFYLDYVYNISSVGIELNTEYYKRSLINLENYIGNKDRISFKHIRAENYEIENENVFYFFNPFSALVFKRVLNKIQDSYKANPREMTIIIYYPEVETLMYIETHTIFKLYTEIPTIEDIRKNKREKFCIYKTK